MESLIVATFTFGFSIFYALSLIEFRVWGLIFGSGKAAISEDELRFTHKSLKRMTPLLPPSNGLVILVGLFLLMRQASDLGWGFEAAVMPIFYLTMMLFIVLVLRNPAVVFTIRAQDETTELSEIRKAIRRVGRDHHIALFTNLSVVLYQLLVINNL
jgi:hypothetical protein